MHDSLAQVRGSEYKIQQSVGLYPTSGTSDDYAFSRNRLDPLTNKVYGFTIEFGKEETGFIPSYPEMQNIIKDISAGLTEFCIAVSSS